MKEHLIDVTVSKYHEPDTTLLEELRGRAEPELSAVIKDVTWGGPASALDRYSGRRGEKSTHCQVLCGSFPISHYQIHHHQGLVMRKADET